MMDLRHMLAMVRVTDVNDDEAPTVLLVDNNQMSLHRLGAIFRQREFNVVTCDDGDKAVDEYIRLDPELGVLSLDIPSLDGHLAALEMREHGKDCRILFSAPKRQAQLASDATHSAGAIGWIEKPVTASAIDSIWDLVLGPIPDAPGLQDLDTLHPVEEMIVVEEDAPPAPMTLPMPIAINPLPTEQQVPTKKKSSAVKNLLIGVIILGALGAGGWYAWTAGLI